MNVLSGCAIESGFYKVLEQFHAQGYFNYGLAREIGLELLSQLRREQLVTLRPENSLCRDSGRITILISFNERR
jgi:hypothetical protein